MFGIVPLDAQKPEGNTGSTPFTFTVTPINSAVASTVRWSIGGLSGTAALADASDFAGGVLPSGTLTFAAGEESQVLTIQIAGDTVPEPDEFFGVTIDSTSGNVAGAAATEGVIINDDGTVPPPDTTPPTLTASAPTDNAIGVAVGSNVVLTFSEAVHAGSGSIVIRNTATGAAFATIAVTDTSQVAFLGSTVTINPTADLSSGTTYDVEMASGVVRDLAGNAFAGINDPATVNFTTSTHGVDFRAGSGTATTGMDLSAIPAYNGAGRDTYTGGTQFVGVYIGTANGSGYLRSNPDIKKLVTDNRLSVVSIFERTPTTAGYFTTKQADADVADAIVAGPKGPAAATLAGQTAGAIYFTVDTDPPSMTFLHAVDNYFRDVRADFNASGTSLKLGVYGPGDVLSMLVNDSAVAPDYTWLDLNLGPRNGFGGENIDRTLNSTPTHPNIIGHSTHGADLDTALTRDFGQWGGTTSVAAM